MYIVFVNPNYKLKKYYILKKTNVKNKLKKTIINIYNKLEKY